MPQDFLLRPAHKPVNSPLLILLHGKGANEDDLFALARHFDPRFQIISLRAPHEMAPGYYRWYERFDTPQGSVFDLPEIEASLGWLREQIPELIHQHQADPAHIHLFGFSQGAAMALATALAEPEGLRSVVSIAGRLLPGYQDLAPRSGAAVQPAILLQHGAADDLVPATESERASTHFTTLGLRTQHREYPGCGHTISPGMLKDALAFQRNILDQDLAHS